MSKIILLSDVYEWRAQKQKELEYYTEKLEELEQKLFFIRKEMQLTAFIIDMIEKEKVHNIGAKDDDGNT